MAKAYRLTKTQVSDLVALMNEHLISLRNDNAPIYSRFEPSDIPALEEILRVLNGDAEAAALDADY